MLERGNMIVVTKNRKESRDTLHKWYAKCAGNAIVKKQMEKVLKKNK